MNPPPDNALVVKFLKSYDHWLSPGCQKLTPEDKELLVRLRPAVRLLAENDPDKMELMILRWRQGGDLKSWEPWIVHYLGSDKKT